MAFLPQIGVAIPIYEEGRLYVKLLCTGPATASPALCLVMPQPIIARQAFLLCILAAQGGIRAAAPAPLQRPPQPLRQRRMGVTTMRLETGSRQPEAVGLYERAGYYRIPPFGDYWDDPVSLRYKKRLGASGP